MIRPPFLTCGVSHTEEEPRLDRRSDFNRKAIPYV